MQKPAHVSTKQKLPSAAKGQSSPTESVDSAVKSYGSTTESENSLQAWATPERSATPNAGDTVDTPSTMSAAPSHASLIVDDVPPTPKKPDSHNGPELWTVHVPEMVFVALGAATVFGVAFLVYKKFWR